MKRYDYIIAGAGCAGLSLLMHFLHSGQFAAKKILLVDKAPKTANDHTWCFWEEGKGLFEPIVSGRWSQLDVHFPEHTKTLSITPYEYKMIRADDFYRYCFEEIARHPAIEVKYGNIDRLEINHQEAVLTIAGEQIAAEYIFSSIEVRPFLQQKGRHYLLQHFKGWMVEMAAPVFDSKKATLMDFRIPQENGTSFVYVLPVSATKAMVEATLFSKIVLPQAEYRQMLAHYLSESFPGVNYRVLEEEDGVIPMTNHLFPVSDGRIIYLGTVGGRTKASTGYTFNPIQEHSRQLTNQLSTSGHPHLKQPKSKWRFRFYDSILLRLLAHNTLPGAAIFERLFLQNEPQQIFRFLDDATSLREELKLTMTLQKGPFIRAALRELIG